MKKNNKKLLKIVKTLLILSMWTVILLGIMKTIELRSYMNEHPEKSFSWKAGEHIPEEAKIKMDMISNVKHIIFIGILIVWTYLTVDYFYDPENHFMYHWIKKMERLENNKEE